jgi:dethiobiotin synthetase
MSAQLVSRETAQRRLVVLGTGTGVGKTHVAVALVAALVGRGKSAYGLKPIESGVEEGVTTDADQLAAVGSIRPEPAPYRLADPVSPHLAARRSGVVISLEVVDEWTRRHPAGFVVIESAGAVLSPLGPAVSNADLTRSLAPERIVLVGLDRLGILHEVACCMLALRTFAPELPRPIIVLNAPSVPDASTGTNAQELEELGTAAAIVEMPRAAPTSAASLAAAREVLVRLGIG